MDETNDTTSYRERISDLSMGRRIGLGIQLQYLIWAQEDALSIVNLFVLFKEKGGSILNAELFI